MVTLRPSLDDPEVQALVAQLGAGASPPDLGGTMSLNLHLESAGLVLRIHPEFVTRKRLLRLRDLRFSAARAGLIVGEPREIGDEPFVAIGDRLAEVETYVASTKPPASWDSYVWMFGAMGALHRVLADEVDALPEPVVATYGPPRTLRAELPATIEAVAGNPEASALAARVQDLVDELERQWIDQDDLAAQVIHGDIRLGNVTLTAAREAAYFDFGFAAHRPRIHELAYSLSWMVLRPDDRGRAEDFAWDRVPELFEAYEDGAGVRLEPIEVDALGPYLAAVPLYLASIASHTPDPAAHVRGELPFIDIAEWVLRNGPVARS